MQLQHYVPCTGMTYRRNYHIPVTANSEKLKSLIILFVSTAQSFFSSNTVFL